MRARFVTVALLLAVALYVAGCATGGGSQFQNTVYDTHRRVVNLDKSLEGSVNKLNETSASLLARVNESEQATRALQSVVEENQVKLDELQKTVNQLVSAFYTEFRRSQGGLAAPGGRMSEVVPEGEVQVTPPAGGTPAAPTEEREALEPMRSPQTASPAPVAEAPAVGGNAEAEYQKAQRSFANQDYTGALEQFTAFLERYPTSESCANALFWKGKSYQNLERYEDAIKDYEKLRANYPTNGKVPLAIHQQAVCQARLGQTDRAIKMFEEVIKNYPTSSAAKQAESDLQLLKKGN